MRDYHVSLEGISQERSILTDETQEKSLDCKVVGFSAALILLLPFGEQTLFEGQVIGQMCWLAQE